MQHYNGKIINVIKCIFDKYSFMQLWDKMNKIIKCWKYFKFKVQYSVHKMFMLFLISIWKMVLEYGSLEKEDTF